MENLLCDILERAKVEKKRNIFLLIEVVVEIIKRCPYLAEAPKEEQMELLKILKEKGVI